MTLGEAGTSIEARKATVKVKELGESWEQAAQAGRDESGANKVTLVP